MIRKPGPKQGPGRNLSGVASTMCGEWIGQGDCLAGCPHCPGQARGCPHCPGRRWWGMMCARAEAMVMARN